jgi:hypothetical protein
MPVDDDVNMSDAEPLYPELHHIRIPSTSSSTSSDASSSPASFDSRKSSAFYGIGSMEFINVLSGVSFL